MTLIIDRKTDVVAYTKAYQAAKYEQMNYRTKLLYSARARAKKNGIECTISEKDLVLVKKCPLLGVAIDYSCGKSKGPAQNSPSLDRIDNSKGYVPGNVWIVSHKANSMKNSASREELLLFAKNIQLYFGKNL